MNDSRLVQKINPASAGNLVTVGHDKLDGALDGKPCVIAHESKDGEITWLIGDRGLEFPVDGLFHIASDFVKEQWYGRSLIKKTPKAWEPDSKGLILLHGAFSSTVKTFNKLLTPEFVERLDYDLVMGINHPTMSEGVRENVDHILGMYPLHKMGSIDLIGHSRGGLVARALAGVESLNVGKVVCAATPHKGTPIAEKGNWDIYLNVLTKIFSLSGGFLKAGLIQSLAPLAHNLANGVFNLPGIDDCAKHRYWGDSGDIMAIGASFTPTREQLLSNLYSLSIGRRIFSGPHDMVVPLDSALSDFNNRMIVRGSHNALLGLPQVRTRILEFLS